MPVSAARSRRTGGGRAGRLPAGEVHRVRGEFAAAEEAFREASRRVRAAARLGAAAAGPGERRRSGGRDAARRRRGPEPPERAALLPAYVEILLGIGDVPAARRACTELEALAHRWEGGMLPALVAHSRGAVELAEGDARAALVALRRRAGVAGARGAVRGRAGGRAGRLACSALGDDDTAALELEAARARSPGWAGADAPASTR